MYRGKSQQSRQKQSKIKNPIERARPNQSKNKTYQNPSPGLGSMYNKNATIYTSPGISKNSQQDKQNIDLFQNVVKILSAAAEPRQKQILLSLASQVQKQKKIKGYLNKQSISDRSELQAMLNHLRQQQIKQISSLKIQIGKRKLQVLDQHDLRQDILNLNSYVMRRTKKQSANVKQKGIDLIGQIYNKFDEQIKLIGQLMGADKVASRPQNIYNIYEKQSKSQMANTKKLFENTALSCYNMTGKYQKLEPQFENNSNANSQVSISSSRSQLMQKILALEKDNLRLIKQVSKIQEQFECVVQQKLLLQQRLQRVEATASYNKKTFQKHIKLFKSMLNQQRKNFQKQKIQIIKTLSNYNRYLEYEVSQYLHHFQQQNRIKNDQQVLEQSPQINKSYISQNELRQNYNEVKQSIQSQTGLIDKYQVLLTQKQFQINSLLKTIAKNNQQKQQIKIQLNQQKKKIQQKNLLLFKLKQKIQRVYLIIQHIKVDKNRIFEQFTLQKQILKEFLNLQGQNLQKNIEYFGRNIVNLKIQKQNRNISISFLNSEIKQKQIKIQTILKQNSVLLLEKQKWEKLYDETKKKSQRQKTQFVQQINRIQNILISQQQKAEENIAQMKKSLTILSIQNQQNSSKQIYIQQLLKNQQQLQKSLGLKQNLIQQLKIKTNNLQRQNQQLNKLKFNLSQKYEQIIKQLNQAKQLNNKHQQTKNMNIQISEHDKILKKISEKNQDDRNIMIEECGMLLQRKAEEIQLIKLQLERQKIQKQDLLSIIRQKFIIKSKRNTTQQMKKKLYKLQEEIMDIKNSLILFLTVLKSNIALNSEFCQQNFQNFLNYILKKKQQKTQKLQISSQLFNDSYNPFKRQLDAQQSFNQFYKLICQVNQSNLIANQEKKGKLLAQIQNLKIKLNNLQIIPLTSLKNGEDTGVCENSGLKHEKSLIQNQQLINCEAISQYSKQEEKIVEKSSFLNEYLKQIQQQSQPKYLDISDIINESVIVDQVSALRNELAQSIKRNETLEKQLKLYQQKDMDKIFDF